MWNRGVFLNDKVMQEKAKRIQFALNQSLPPQEQLNMQFRNGQLYSFKQRHNLKCYKSHEEQGDADDEGARAALPRFWQLAARYSLADIFNADGFGLCNSAAPKSTIGPGFLPGCKVNRTEQLSWCAQTLMGVKVSLLFSSTGLVGQSVSKGWRKKF